MQSSDSNYSTEYDAKNQWNRDNRKINIMATMQRQPTNIYLTVKKGNKNGKKGNKKNRNSQLK